MFFFHLFFQVVSLLVRLIVSQVYVHEYLDLHFLFLSIIFLILCNLFYIFFNVKIKVIKIINYIIVKLYVVFNNGKQYLINFVFLFILLSI